MAFTKPLKVFLSYSHGDNPRLFRAFRNQLTALEDDDVIKVWTDREITAGQDWDREIKTGLNECDLFIALTSSSFNASGYIRGIEMERAWERYDGGQCRIIPIMWSKWRPTERIGALQFLPGLDHDVASARNRDNVLCNIIEAIERVVKEMTEGRWSPRRPVLELLPAELPYLCDWMGPIAQLKSLRVPPGSAPRPGVLILIGTLDDCPEAFLNRTHRSDLPRALDAQGLPVHDARPMDWPTDTNSAPDALYQALDAEPEWEIEKKLRPGLTIVKTNTSDWDATKGAVLDRLLSEWQAAAWTLPATRRLLLVISIISARRDGALQKQIETVIQRRPGLPCTVITFPEIERDHAVNWASHPEVLRRCHPDRRNDLPAAIWQLYERAGNRVLPMKPLASELLKLLEQYREKGAA